jgi:Holliday junction resolvasome RuvABC DNA-binding subunit
MVINYIIGKLVSVHKGYIILENNYIGYKLYPVDDMRNYNIGKVLKLYIIDETHCS